MRDWCSGNMFDSKSNAVGSIPTSRAITFFGSEKQFKFSKIGEILGVPLRISS